MPIQPRLPPSPFADAAGSGREDPTFLSPPPSKRAGSQAHPALLRTPPAALPTPPLRASLTCTLGHTPSFSSWIMDATCEASASAPPRLADVVACLPGRGRAPLRDLTPPTPLERLLADPALNDADYAQRVAAWDDAEAPATDENAQPPKRRLRSAARPVRLQF